MKQYFITMLLALCAAFANVGIPLPAHAQSEASTALAFAANAVGRVLLFGEKLS